MEKSPLPSTAQSYHGRKGPDGAAGGHRGRPEGSVLLLPPRPGRRWFLPRLPRKIEKMPKLQVSCSVPAADGMVVHDGDARCHRGARRGLRVPADQPPARLSGLRQGRRVSAAGLLVPVRARREPHGVPAPDLRRRRREGRRRLRSDADAEPQPLHPLHALRPFHARNRRRRADWHRGPRLRQRDSTFEEQGVHSLLSGNLLDVCPVGAITTRDYRFKSRPWDNPSAVDTTCTLCEKGCNTTGWLRAKPEWAKGAQLVRFMPRTTSRSTATGCATSAVRYHLIEGDERLTQPFDGSGRLAKASWDTATAPPPARLSGDDGRGRPAVPAFRPRLARRALCRGPPRPTRAR